MTASEVARSPSPTPARRIAVLEPDARAARQVQIGFQREGIAVELAAIPPDLAALALPADTGVVLVGGTQRPGLALVARARELAGDDVAIAFVGDLGTGPNARAEIVESGADEVLSRPAYLRDVVTVGRILLGRNPAHPDHLAGSLVETTGVYTLVRALSALGRSAVLTLIRGLRRGEIRFYRGEVTSAQVGLIHGQAAFHQLLLWTDARFDFSREDIVRRAQIPMTPDELFADAERFLEGVREAADQLSPSMVLEQDVQRVAHLGKQVPTEVLGVLRMFDGHRVLADILEDSPYRVFETLRVAQKALEAGLVRVIDEQRPKASWRAVLAIEEWLVGAETREAVVERTASIDTTRVAVVPPPSAGGAGGKKKKKRKKQRRAATPLPVAPEKVKSGEIDWGALVPRSIGGEVGQVSGVVPAMNAQGEIEVATRDRSREKLEALMDTGKRDRIFPTEVGLEPTIVVRDDDVDTGELERAAAPRRVSEEIQKMQLERELRAEQAEREREAAARAKAAEEEQTYAAKVKADAERKRDEAERAKIAAAEAEAAAATAAAPKVSVTSEIETKPNKITADAKPADAKPAEVKDSDAAPSAAGEISPAPARVDASAAADAPSILVAEEPATSAALVADLAAAHTAIAAVMEKAAAEPPTEDAASPSKEIVVAEVRRDAVELTAAEEAFFSAVDQSHAQPKAPDNFDDLDHGYQKPRFWDRVFGRKPKH